MNAASISAVPSDHGIQLQLQPPAPPAAATAAASRFSDLLATHTSSLAAFELLTPVGSDGLSSLGSTVPATKKTDPNSDSSGVAVSIALPAPVQSPPPPPANGGSGSDSNSASSGGAKTQAASDNASTQAAGTGSATIAGTPGSAGTAGTSNGTAQLARGTALPPNAADLGARVAVGAQGLISQPSQTLASLPHAALAATPNSLDTPTPVAPAAATHGTLAPDPSALLGKLTPSTTAAAAAAAPPAPIAALETASQTVAPQVATATAEAASLAATSNAGAGADPNPSASAQPTPVLMPVPASMAAPPIETATLPTVAASALDQVAYSLKQSLKGGLNQIEIQLKPASLGAVDIRLELSHDGRVTAVISADRSDTLMQLQRGSGELQQALQDAGLQTDSGSLSFSLRGDAQTGDQGGRQSGYTAPQVGTVLGDDLSPGPVAAAAVQASHAGILNIQV
jgi:flagellar hook-length control protein FliK